MPGEAIGALSSFLSDKKINPPSVRVGQDRRSARAFGHPHLNTSNTRAAAFYPRSPSRGAARVAMFRPVWRWAMVSRLALPFSVALRRKYVERSAGWSREQLAAHQARSLAQLRRYAYAQSPFYRRFHAGLEQRPLAELPVLTKATAMEHFDELVTERELRLAKIEAFVRDAGPYERFRGRYVVRAAPGGAESSCSTPANGTARSFRSRARWHGRAFGHAVWLWLPQRRHGTTPPG
jgi:hypothetical protein